ncbi:FGGY family carbohydrate kinase [Streptomyces rhizosphaericus]|uniref:FGGY family carbohydrate kinase n=1 Tax=Streptomyces rhizosphaericus TaxID=114699 RepID=UPI003637AC4C
MTVLTVDVGTSVIKSVVFDAEGREVAVSRTGTEVLRPHPGWAEQDMDAVWRGVVSTVRGALAQLGPGHDAVRLIAFTAQGDGCWLVDGDGRPTGPAILWSDGRAGDLLARWQAEGVLAEAYRRNGSLTCAGMPNAVLTWLAEHDPARLERSHTALTAAGWLFLRLTGVTAIDASDASAPSSTTPRARTTPRSWTCSAWRGPVGCCRASSDTTSASPSSPTTRQPNWALPPVFPS